jgi:DNA replication protein DnaC
VQAVEHHRKKVRFYGTVDLVNALEQEKAQGRSGQIADRLMRCDLVILDSCGVGSYVELPHEVGL